MKTLSKKIKIADLAPMKDPVGGKHGRTKKNLKGDPGDRPDPVILPPFFVP